MQCQIQRSHKKGRASAIAVLGATLAALFFGTSAPALAGIEARQQADELLPVDCLLPGAVRKLGGQLTYLTARRPIKTTGVNCEIRGGEYVLYDRADYETALAIWLPMAESGDARAQNYVGEIYEKGLGTTPNYPLAAHWYSKAAEQDYAPAQVNLGQLYELGQGVNPSKDLALNLYREAAGIKGSQLRFVSWDYSEEEYQALSGQIADKDAALRQQQQQIQALTRKLDASKSREQQLTAEISAARSHYRDEILALDSSRKALAEKEAALAAMQSGQTAAAASNADLTAQRKEIAKLQAELESQRSELETAQRAAQQQSAELARMSAETAQEKQALTAEKESAINRSAELRDQLAALTLREEQLLAKQTAFEQQQREAQIAAQQAQSSNQDMAQALQKQQEELESLRREVAQRESELANRESELHTKNTELQNLEQQLSSLQGQLVENASAFSGQSDLSPAQAQEIQKPVIEMIEPQLLATRGDQYVVKTRAGIDQRTIIGRVMSHNPLMQVLVNDHLVSVDERGLFQQRVPLQGKETQVSIVAIDQQGLRSDLQFLLGVEDATEADLIGSNAGSAMPEESKRKVPRLNFGNYHALIIGNKDYQSLPDLDTTVYDAQALRDVLRDRYGFSTTLLTDATRYDILSAMEKLRSELDEDDNLLIYYAGHGELDEVNTRGHWLPVDAEEDSRANWISNVAISDILNSMSANKVLVVADSCYSGSMTRSTLARLDAGRSKQAWVSWLKKQANSHSRLLFSSGGVAPVLDGGGGKHSIFAKALLDVLRNNDGVLEGRQVHQQVAQAVNYAALAAQFDQTPLYAPIKFAGHEGGDFLFVANSD